MRSVALYTATGRIFFREKRGDAERRKRRAVNGTEAVRLVQNNPEDYFDLVFMDVQMPEMDGYEAAGRIRQYEKKLKRKHLPIIALTANVFAEDSERALRAGMDAHMGKPVEVPQLLATMMHWIG